MEELIKHRSIPSCIAAAWHTWRDDAGTIIRSTWLPMLVCALAGAIHSFVHLSDVRMDHFRENTTILSGLLTGLSALGMFVGMVWLLSRLFNFLNQKGRAYNLRRAGIGLSGYIISSSIIIAVVIMILYLCGVPFSPTPSVSDSPMMVPEGVTAPHPFTMKDIPWWAWHLGGALLTCFVLLPLVHHTIRYQMQPETLYIKHLGHGLKEGAKNWGFLLGTTLVTGLVLGLVTLVPALPLFLLHTAEAQSTVGVIDGDPSGMPASIPWLYALVSFVVGVLNLYIWQFFLFAQTFAVMRLKNNVPPQFPSAQ